jgi:hypothetical protein
MVQKAEIIVEKFSNGITLNWTDPTGEADPEKMIAIKGKEPVSLGEMIWGDVEDILENSTGKRIKVSINYTEV